MENRKVCLSCALVCQHAAALSQNSPCISREFFGSELAPVVFPPTKILALGFDRVPRAAFWLFLDRTAGSDSALQKTSRVDGYPAVEQPEESVIPVCANVDRLLSDKH